MITKESEILGVFAKEPWRTMTFTEIKDLSKKRSKSYVSMALKKFVKNGIIVQEAVGRIPVYSLNISFPKARVYAGTILEFAGWSKRNIPYKDMQTLIEKIPYASHITLITGSFARGTQHKKSDIDVVVIIENSCDPKKVYAELKLQSELSIPPIHLYVFRNSEFIDMLKGKEVNYGKEIVKNCLILSQGQTYLKLVDEAIKNGFNGKSLC